MNKLSKVLEKDKVFFGYSSVGKNISNTKIYDIELINRDILNSFMIRKGEKVMDPEFGTIIWDFLFEPLTEVIKNQIIVDVQRILNFEPRVELKKIDLIELDYGFIIYCSLLYKPFNLVDDLYIQFSRRNFTSNDLLPSNDF